MPSDDPKIIEGTWTPVNPEQEEARLVRVPSDNELRLTMAVESAARNLDFWLTMMNYKDEVPFTTPHLIIRHLREALEKCRS